METSVIILYVAVFVLGAFVIYMIMNGNNKSSYNPSPKQVSNSPPSNSPNHQPSSQPQQLPPLFSGIPIEQLVAENEPVFLMIWSNGCGHCERIKPEWSKAREMLKDKIKLADYESSSGNVFDVQGYPTLRLYLRGLGSPQDFIEYSGDRSVQSFIDFVRKNV